MTVEKACGYIREALEEMGYPVVYRVENWWWVDKEFPARPVGSLLMALDSLDPMGTTYKEEG